MWSRENSIVMEVTTEPGNANVLVIVRLINPDTGETFTRNDIRGNDLNAEQLGQIIDRTAELLNIRDTNAEALKVLKGQPVPAPTPPDQAKIDADNFFLLLYKLNAIRDSVSKGLTKADDQALIDLEVGVKETFRTEYTTDFRWK